MDIFFRMCLLILLPNYLTYGQAQSLSQDELPKKPMHERMLPKEYQIQVDALVERVGTAIAKKRLGEAVTLGDEIVELRTGVQGSDHWEVVDARIYLETLRSLGAHELEEWDRGRNLNFKGVQLSNEKKDVEAKKCNDEALKIFLEVLGEDHPDTGSAYGNRAYCLESIGKIKEAQEYHELALAITQRKLGENHPDYATNLNNMAFNLRHQGKILEAISLIRKALDIRRNIQGELHEDTGTCYNNLAFMLESIGESVEAEVLYRKSLEISLRLHGEIHPRTAEVYNNIACLIELDGRAFEAHPLFLKSVVIRRSLYGELHPELAGGYINLATNLLHQGKFLEAEVISRKALDIVGSIYKEDHLLTASANNGFANILFEQKRESEAEPYFEKALEIRRKIYGEEHGDTALSYQNLARILLSQGKIKEADFFNRRALDCSLRVHGDVNDLTIQCNLLRAMIEVKLDNATEANHLCDKVLADIRTFYDVGDRYSTLSYISIAYLMHGLGRVPDAERVLREACPFHDFSRLQRSIGIDRALGEKENPRILLAAIEQASSPVDAWRHFEMSVGRGFFDQQFGNELSVRRQYGEVESALRKSINELKPRLLALASNGSRSPEDEAELRASIGKRKELGRRLAEVEVASSSVGLASNAEIQAALPANGSYLFWVDSHNGFPMVQEHFACVVRREGEPFWVRLPGSGEGGAWTKADSDLPGRVRDALAKELPPEDIEETVAALRRQRIEPVLHHLSQHGIDQLLVVGVNQMAGVPIEVLAPEFAISYVPSGTFLARLPKKPAYDKSLLAVGDPVYELDTGKQDRIAALPPHGLLVREAVAEGAATKAGIRAGDVLLQYGDRKLESVAELRQSIQDFIDAGRDTIDVVIWRVGVDGFSVENTVTVPIGPLGVSLSPDPAPKAISDAREADSFFSSIRRGDNWTDLPGTRYEVSRISELFPNANVLLDRDASERGIEGLRVSGELSKFRYLHFATHGKGNSNSAFESKLALAQDGEKEEFAQAGSPWINNEISAREVLDHWKIGADLVTLSACESGVGRQGGGDGLLGFAQAFLISGARSVCLSLWNVDDTATALLMHRFYQNLLGKRPGLSSPMTKVAALKEAKEWLRNLSTSDALDAASDLTKGVSRGGRGEVTLKTRIGSEKSIDKPFSEPHYWSAFILVGDPE